MQFAGAFVKSPREAYQQFAARDINALFDEAVEKGWLSKHDRHRLWTKVQEDEFQKRDAENRRLRKP